jgi:ankyrin repeat protein
LLSYLLTHSLSADVTIKDRNGLTPLHWACLNLDDQALRTLCQHVHDTDLEDKHGRTPLLLAITEGKSVKSESSGSVNQKHLKHCIEILLDLKADGERSDAAGTPLISYLAAGWLQDALLSFVKKYHYKVDIAVDTHGYNALHYCLMDKSIRNSVGLGSCLLRKIPANSTEKEDSNTTGGVVTLQTLLRAGARPNYRTRDGKSPIQLLIENYEAWGSYIDEAVTMLVSYGGRIDEQSLTALKGYEINCNIKYDEVVAEWIGDAASNADALHLTANMYENTSETIATSTSSLCVLCSTSFSLFRRQHHCRICNVLCCDDCSKKRVVLEGTQQRACDSCFNIIVNKNYMLKVLTHSLTHSVTYLLTYSLTHALTYLLTH